MNKFRLAKPNSSQAFTLIELLVSVAILVLLTGIAIPAYLKFNRRQKIREVKKEIEASFTQAASKAKNGQIAGCDTLQGYQIRANDPGTGYVVQIMEDCVNDANESSWNTVYELPVDVVFGTGGDNFYFYIDSLTGRVTDSAGGNGPWTIELEGETDSGTATYSFTIDSRGNFSDGLLS